MFALRSRYLRRRLSAQSSGSVRRRARERRLAEETRAEGERLARERRDQRLRDKIEQQRQACEELASYEPWGRAGGGAPNANGPRFCDLRMRGLYPEDELKGLSVHEMQGWWGPRRSHRARPPHHDPPASNAEPVRDVVDDKQLDKQPEDTQDSYKKDLDELVLSRKKTFKDEMQRNLEYERKMQRVAGPWGRPGPGGTKWRNPRDIGLNFSKSMGWTDNEMFKKIKGDHRRRKRSSLTLPEVKRDEDLPDKGNKTSNVEKLPDIVEKNGHSKKDSRDSSGEKPKGNGKARSPKKKYTKRLSSDVVKHIEPEDMQTKVDQENQLTPESVMLRLTGGVELVPLLARRRRVGARTLPSSDVTRPPEQQCQWREILNVDYLRELKNQIRVKCQQKEESRRDSAESCIKHHDTWSSLWGRPGHGAPQLRGRYARNNLARLLYVPPAL